MAVEYKKHFIPLESNPEVFNELIHLLGASPSIQFVDIFTLDDPSALPPKILALVLIFPTTPSYEARIVSEDAKLIVPDEEHEDAVWFKQTIHNACGLYAALHALSNGRAKDFIQPNSLLDNLLAIASPMEPEQASLVLEGSEELESAYAAVASKGATAAPENAEDEVDYHYICFTKSPDTGHLFELNGDQKGPIDRGLLEEEHHVDLGSKSIKLVKDFITAEEGNIGFSLMALVDRS